MSNDDLPKVRKTDSGEWDSGEFIAEADLTWTEALSRSHIHEKQCDFYTAVARAIKENQA